jgi:GNAT superfamily N-acetyltransferase
MSIRPLEQEDLPLLAALYAELDKRDPGLPAPGYVEFFRRTLLEAPLADPEIPSLVYDDPRDGVVGVIGSHPRRFLFGEEPVRLACSGPLIVHPGHRPRGIGALLLRRFAAGPQEMTFNDRSGDGVHTMWRLLGADTDAAASIGWRRVLAPAGAALGTISRRMPGRRRAARRRLPDRRRAPGAAAAASGLDAVAGRGYRPPVPASGSAEPLGNEDLLDLRSRLRRQFPLRPAYDEEFLAALFAAMEGVVLGERLLRRLVRGDDGRPLGSYVISVSAQGGAQVLDLTAAYDDAGLVLDHAFQDAAGAGAVEVGGRVEPALLPHLAPRRCRLERADWVTVKSGDARLVNAVLSGRALLSRMDGEWWMRPRPEAR